MAALPSPGSGLLPAPLAGPWESAGRSGTQGLSDFEPGQRPAAEVKFAFPQLRAGVEVTLGHLDQAPPGGGSGEGREGSWLDLTTDGVWRAEKGPVFVGQPAGAGHTSRLKRSKGLAARHPRSTVFSDQVPGSPGS